jgi:hypothetical protein
MGEGYETIEMPTPLTHHHSWTSLLALSHRERAQ